MEIVGTQSNLPTTTEELHKFIIVGKEKLKAHKAKLRAIEKIEVAHTAKEAALSDAQDVADIVLEAESRLGEMLSSIKPVIESSGRGTIEKKKSLPHGITKKESHYAQEIHRHPEAVRQVKEKARQEGRIATSQEVLKEVRKTKQEELSKTLKPSPLPENKYSIIYSDPPWKYEFSRSTNRDIENQYPTMALEQIENLPVGKLFAEDSVLFLWVTSPKLKEGMRVLESWGFQYVTCAVWDKEKIGMGYYFRQQHEILLVGKKGNLPVPLPENRHSSIISSLREKHSQKPEVIYEIIERMYPDSARIELFARKEREGWKCWGNEIS